MLLTATLCLLAVGAVMVYSASSARAVIAGDGRATAYLVKYVVFGAVGFGLMHLLARVPLTLVRRFTPLMLAGAFVLLLLVLIPGVGISINGARRWLGAGPIQFQPSEVMKLALVLHVCAVIAARPKVVRELRLVMVPIMGVGGVAVLMVAGQPDLGTALVISFTMAAMLTVAGLPPRQLGLVAALGSVLVMIYAVIEPYRRERLTAFVNPWRDAGDSGFQSVQGQIAIGSGGLLGVGPGQSVQKDLYLPEGHTDFILAILGEELGLAGITLLLLLYGMIAYAGLRTAKSAKGTYAKLLAAGLTSLILCQALLNTWAVLGLAPLTGVPLPFISSGSTSLIVLLASMGLLLNVAGGGSAHLQSLPSRKPERDTGSRQSARCSGPRRRSCRRAAAGR